MGTTTQSIEVIAAPSANVVPDTIVCNANIGQGETVIDFNGLTDSDGFWTDPGVPGLDFTDLSNVDFTGLDPDTYVFQFTTNIFFSIRNKVSSSFNNSLYRFFSF